MDQRDPHEIPRRPNLLPTDAPKSASLLGYIHYFVTASAARATYFPAVGGRIFSPLSRDRPRINLHLSKLDSFSVLKFIAGILSLLTQLSFFRSGFLP